MRGVEEHWRSLEIFNGRFSSFSVHLNLVFAFDDFSFFLCTFFDSLIAIIHRQNYSQKIICRSLNFFSLVERPRHSLMNSISIFFSPFLRSLISLSSESEEKNCRNVVGAVEPETRFYARVNGRKIHRKLMTKLICRLWIHTMFNLYAHERTNDRKRSNHKQIFLRTQFEVSWAIEYQVVSRVKTHTREWERAKAHTKMFFQRLQMSHKITWVTSLEKKEQRNDKIRSTVIC